MSDDVPECKPLKPLLSGSIPVDQFVQTLEKVISLQWQARFKGFSAELRNLLLCSEREIIFVWLEIEGGH